MFCERHEGSQAYVRGEESRRPVEVFFEGLSDVFHVGMQSDERLGFRQMATDAEYESLQRRRHLWRNGNPAVPRLDQAIESLFSMMKTAAEGFCWSRGRERQNHNRLDPCTAWKNEVLCKLIYANLRTTVTAEEKTGIEIDYLVRERFFFEPADGLLTNAV